MLSLKTLMEFASIGDSKKGKASVVGETARQTGMCFVLIFSMLPKSQTQF